MCIRDRDNTARVWNADGSGSTVVLEGHTGPLYSASFSSDGGHIVTVSHDDNTARVWNADGSGSPVVLEGQADIDPSFNPRFQSLRSASFSPDGTRVVTASGDAANTARVWNADGTGTPVELKGHTEHLVSASFSPDGTRIVTGSWDKTARVWNADGSGSPVVLKGNACVLKASFSPDGSRIVMTRLFATARVLNADGSGSAITLGDSFGADNASFNPDGTRIVATAENDWTARVWNADGSGSAAVLGGHTGRVHSASFSPDGARIVTASEDNTAGVWRAADLVGDTRTILWQTPFCHLPRRRMELLGEPKELAIEHYNRCLELTSICTREDYDTCHEAVTRAFGA